MPSPIDFCVLMLRGEIFPNEEIVKALLSNCRRCIRAVLFKDLAGGCIIIFFRVSS